jgi:hypothetical protein
MSDIWNSITEGADALWDGVTDAGDAVVDFFTPEPETGTITSAPPSGNKFYAPIHWDGL